MFSQNYPSIHKSLHAHDNNTSFYINFCRIRGPCSNFRFVEHHISFSKSTLLSLTETEFLGVLTVTSILFPHIASILSFVVKLVVAYAVATTSRALVPTVLTLHFFPSAN